jgi:AraC-like DNA-binding protein
MAASISDVGAAGRPTVPSEVMAAIALRRGPSTAHLRAAKDLMDRDFARPLDLDALAREAGYSRFHFARAFRDTYGETPHAYLTRRRIERAKDLLRWANLTVTEICDVVGFASLGSFSARFSELVGASPTVYRRRAVERGGAPPIPGCFVMMWTRPRGAVEA